MRLSWTLPGGLGCTLGPGASGGGPEEARNLSGPSGAIPVARNSLDRVVCSEFNLGGLGFQDELEAPKGRFGSDRVVDGGSA